MEIEKLKERLWNLASDENISVYEIETFLRNFFKQKPLPLFTLPFENYCRCSLNKKGEIFETVKRCSYNPFVENIEMQRCNYDKQQVFYAAVPTQAKIKCTGTSIMEVTWEHISNKFLDYYFLTLSRWMTKRPLKVFYFPDFPSQDTFDHSVDLEKDLMETEGINKDNISYFISILTYFREIFSAKADKKIWYRISSAFFNCIMRFSRDENQGIDGIVYSSANTGKEGTNIVLNKELIDTEILYCDYVQMWIAKRNSKDPTDIWFYPISDGVVPKSDGTFNIDIYPEFLDKFNNALPLDITAIVPP